MAQGSNRHIHFAPVPVRHGIGIVADPLPVYYERFDPLETTGKPVVAMIHGGSHSGSCYQLTADGRPGWAYVFAARGYPAVTLDWPGMGRSGAVAEAEIAFEAITSAFSN